VIKNALDWGTRPYGQNSWAGKPTAITGTSPGAVGTAVGQARLRGDMLAVGSVVMTFPEAYLQWKPEIYAPDGSVSDESTRAFLQGYVDAFVSWIDKQG
ncbi:MAG TPA: NAD(P)H-dependent oxidoreductase, partial [Paracoccus sp. (in: a-proteobacteria)]|nr:NAD(P)H-dependent oxidoreductase [Paracoccus sp. (in: a-proteobacteria)]